MNPETGAQLDPRQAVQEEFTKEVVDAGADQARKDELARRVKADLVAKKIEADIALEAARSRGGETAPEAKAVMRSVTRAIEAVKQNIIIPPSPEAKAILVNIGAPESVAPDLYAVVYKLINDPNFKPSTVPNTEFDRAFQSICRSDVRAAKILQRALVQAANTGNVAGMDEEQVLTKYDVDKYKPDPEAQRESGIIGDVHKYMAEHFEDRRVFDLLFAEEPGTAPVWNPHGIETLKKEIQEVVGSLFVKVDQDPKGNFEELFNQFEEGRAFSMILSRFNALAKSDAIMNKLDPRLKDEYKNFCEKILLKEIQTEKGLRQLAHVVPLALENFDPEKSVGIANALDLTELANVLQDEFMQEAMQDITNYFRYKFVTNDNTMPSDLMQGRVRDEADPQNRLYEFREREDFIKMWKERRRINGQEVQLSDEKKMTRAFTVAQGITLLTGDLTAVMAMTKPIEHFKDLKYARLIKLFNAFHEWKQGRGSRALVELPELNAIRVDRNEDTTSFMHRLMNVLGEHGWDPKEAFELGKQWKKRLDEVGNDTEFFDELSHIYDEISGSTAYGELLRMNSWTPWNVKGGWRTEGVRRYYLKDRGENSDVTEGWAGGSWEDRYAWYRKRAGVFMEFISAEDRANEETEAYIKSLIGGGDISSYKNLDGANRNNRIATVTYGNGQSETLTYQEFLSKRNHQIAGEGFYHMLLKDPLAFLQSFQQSNIDVSKGFMKIDGLGPKIRMSRVLTLSEAEIRGLPKKSDQDEIKRFQLYYRSRFGTEVDSELTKIMDFYSDLYEKYDAGGPVEERTHSEAEYKIQAQKALFAAISKGRDKLTKDNRTIQEQMEIIRHDSALPIAEKRRLLLEKETLKRVELKAEDIFTTENQTELERLSAGHTAEEESKYQALKDLKIISDLLYGDHGFITSMTAFSHTNGQEDQTKVRAYFGDGKAAWGERNNFYSRTAQAWYTRDHFLLHPICDLDHETYLNEAATAGSNTILRSFQELTDFSKSQEMVLKLPSTLKEIAMSGDAKDVVKSFEPFIKTLEVVKGFYKDNGKGDDQWYELNYNLTTIALHYFQEDGFANKPIVGMLGPLLFGKEFSLSKLNQDSTKAFSMSADETRVLIQYLQRKKLLRQGDGKFSGDALLRAMEIDTPVFLATEVAPNIMFLFTLFLLYTYMKKAMEEAEGGKKH